MSATESPLGKLIRETREARGWSQTRLADAVCDAAQRHTVTRHDVSRWERGERAPGPFWQRNIAAALDLPLTALEAARVERRQFMASAAAATLPALVASDAGRDEQTVSDLFASICGGDRDPLGSVQTSYSTDLAIAAMATQDQACLRRLACWGEDDSSDVVRVNAIGILAKTQTDFVDQVVPALARDEGVRRRYLTAVAARTGNTARALVRELRNPYDAGARWCSAYLLSRNEGKAASGPLVSALRTETLRENIRAYALMLSGEDPCT